MAEIQTWKRKVKGNYKYGVGTREFSTEAQANQYYMDLLNKQNKAEKFTVQNPTTGVVHKFDTEDQANNYIKIQKDKPVKNTDVKFPNPVTGKTETVIDSSAMETRLGDIKKKQKSDIGAKNTKVLEQIKLLEAFELNAKPSEVPAIQAQIDQKYQELETGFKELGIPYERPSGDADEEGGGFFDFLKPSDENAFKAKTRKALMKKLSDPVKENRMALPEGYANAYEYAKAEADRLWDEKINFDPAPKSDAELRDISGRKE